MFDKEKKKCSILGKRNLKDGSTCPKEEINQKKEFELDNASSQQVIFKADDFQ